MNSQSVEHRRMRELLQHTKKPDTVSYYLVYLRLSVSRSRPSQLRGDSRRSIEYTLLLFNS